MPDVKRAEIEAFIATLPDPAAARRFLEDLEAAGLLPARNPLLTARLLTIAAYSPFLAAGLLRHPEQIAWLERETGRDFGRVKSVEELSQELGRFSVRALGGDRRAVLAEFKRRELLRTYLRDCLGVATLAEVTEELSNLADVILQFALSHAMQEAVNQHGAPQTRDARGRIVPAELAIVALGKLGCRELNYASDIDLLFLYAGQGETAGDRGRPETVVSNQEFFARVAGRVVQTVGGNAGEGAVYRVDLRLRPYGRDGDVVWEVERAAAYYRDRAQSWERQALIRARAAAGSETVFARFAELTRDAVFRSEPLPEALADVRRAKEKIDRKAAARAGGFNVKIGRGGIREIEFIAQALQLAYGGREPWVRSTQTLIVLARLAEKNYLSEAERARLSAAYTFLRTVEHRLQMEQGVQTHSLPLGRERLAMLARRCGYGSQPDPAAAFLADLEAHTRAVRAIFQRVFGARQTASADAGAPAERAAAPAAPLDDETGRLTERAAQAVAVVARMAGAPAEDAAPAALHAAIAASLPGSLNATRSLRNLTLWAESLATVDRGEAQRTFRALAGERRAMLLDRLVATLGAPYLAHILVARPMLAAALVEEAHTPHDAGSYFALLRHAVEHSSISPMKTDRLRRAWYRQVVEIGYRDIRGLREEGREEGAWLRANNLEQTALAEAALRLATEIVFESMGVAAQAAALPFAVLGLGRLGHTGMDYGSDMDLLIVFDDAGAWPPPGGGDNSGTPQEFYSKFAAQLVAALSAVTREGFLYRVDLRLRPDGQSGPLAVGLGGLLAYLRERASAWEHSAYLKVREVAGDPAFGERARRGVCEAVFAGAARNASLRGELAAMRARLEREKGRGSRADIKWGPGGMTDVYFVTRYLQLRERISFPTERGTLALIRHLGERGLLDRQAANGLYEGYSFLRRLDHWMRLLMERPRPTLPTSRATLEEIARALRLADVETLQREYARHTAVIREIYQTAFSE